MGEHKHNSTFNSYNNNIILWLIINYRIHKEFF